MKTCTFSAPKLKVLSEGQLICMLCCQGRPLTPSWQKSLQYSLLLYIYRPEFIPVSHLSRKRAKHVHLPPLLKKNAEGKAAEVCFSVFSFCVVITEASGLHFYKYFIAVLMHCTWRKSAHFSCNYFSSRYCLVSQGSPFSDFF